MLSDGTTTPWKQLANHSTLAVVVEIIITSPQGRIVGLGVIAIILQKLSGPHHNNPVTHQLHHLVKVP